MSKKRITTPSTPIPNELMYVLMSKATNASEKAILNCVARKTYGWGKKSDEISLTQFQKDTGLSRQTVNVTTKRLLLVKLLRLVKRGSVKKDCNIYTIDVSSYQEKLVKLVGLVKYDRNSLVKYTRHTKESFTKEKEDEKEKKHKTAPIPARSTLDPDELSAYWDKTAVEIAERLSIPRISAAYNRARDDFIKGGKATTPRAVEAFLKTAAKKSTDYGDEEGLPIKSPEESDRLAVLSYVDNIRRKSTPEEKKAEYEAALERFKGTDVDLTPLHGAVKGKV